MFKNSMRPVHPGKVLREDYLIPLGMTATALAKALNVPAPRINEIVRERRLAGREDTLDLIESYNLRHPKLAALVE